MKKVPSLKDGGESLSDKDFQSSLREDWGDILKDGTEDELNHFLELLEEEQEDASYVHIVFHESDEDSEDGLVFYPGD